MEFIERYLDFLIIVFILLAAIFVPLERLAPHRSEQPILRKGWQTDLIHFSINRLISGAILAVASSGLALVLRSWIPEDLHARITGQALWLQAVESIIVADFFAYLAHRLVHWIPLLWRFHSIHHSIEDLDWLGAFRLHPLDKVFQRALIFIPLYVLGFDATVLGFYGFLFFVHVVLSHSNTGIPFGPLKYVIVTPVFHHWHHTFDSRYRDRNFASLLPVFDWIFGTWHLPSDEWPERYGVPEEVGESYLGQILFPFRRRREGSAEGSGEPRASAGLP